MPKILIMIEKRPLKIISVQKKVLNEVPQLHQRVVECCDA